MLECDLKVFYSENILPLLKNEDNLALTISFTYMCLTAPQIIW